MQDGLGRGKPLERRKLQPVKLIFPEIRSKSKLSQSKPNTWILIYESIILNPPQIIPTLSIDFVFKHKWIKSKGKKTCDKHTHQNHQQRTNSICEKTEVNNICTSKIRDQSSRERERERERSLTSL